MSCADFFIEPFAIPKLKEEAIEVVRYQKIFKSIEVGFSSDNSRILVRQKKKGSLTISPPDHFFVLEVEAVELSESKWLTLEFILSPEQFAHASRITILMSLASSVQEPFFIDLRMIFENGSFEDLRLGQVIPANGERFCTANLSQPLDSFLKFLDKPVKEARILIFAPLAENLKYSLAMLNVFVTGE